MKKTKLTHTVFVYSCLEHIKQRLSCKARPTFKLYAGILSLLVIALLASLLLVEQNYDREQAGKYYDQTRDYKQIPFDMTDATGICRNKTKLKFGEQFVRAHVDVQSSRYEIRSGTFKIFMSADVGNKFIYQEAHVHCFVDPSEYMVSHYRTFEGSDSLMDRSIGRLKSLFN